MAKRSVHPALYEVIRTKPAPARSSGGAPEPADAGDHGAAVGSGARFLRVPIGYVWFVATVVLLALVLAFLFGKSYGERASREIGRSGEADRRQAEELLGQTADPLGTPTEPSGTTSPPARQGGSEAAKPEGAPRSPAAGRGDPRQEGLHYFVLAHPPADGAPGLVQFLRDNGLDACVVPDHNGTLRKVIVLPGYSDEADRKTPRIQQLEQKIRSVGMKWKAAARGNSSFGDYYPERYRPSRTRG